MKHVTIDFHFFYDQVESRKFLVHYILIWAELADTLNNSLRRRSLDNFVCIIGHKKIEATLKGHDKDKDG